MFNDKAIITIQVIDVDETSITGMKADDQLKLYPNPVNRELYLEVTTFLIDGFETVITDLSGRVVYSHTGYIDRIDFSNFRKGIYFITIRSEEFISIEKLVRY